LLLRLLALNKTADSNCTEHVFSLAAEQTGSGCCISQSDDGFKDVVEDGMNGPADGLSGSAALLRFRSTQVEHTSHLKQNPANAGLLNTGKIEEGTKIQALTVTASSPRYYGI
jgi:hypothetical protein